MLHNSLLTYGRNQADLAVIRNLAPREYVQVGHARACKSREGVAQLRWHEQNGWLTHGLLTSRGFRKAFLQSFRESGLQPRVGGIACERRLQQLLEIGLQGVYRQLGRD